MREVLDKGDYTFEYGVFSGIECGFYRCKLCKNFRNAFKCRTEDLMKEHIARHKEREAKLLLNKPIQ